MSEHQFVRATLPDGRFDINTRLLAKEVEATLPGEGFVLRCNGAVSVFHFENEISAEDVVSLEATVEAHKVAAETRDDSVKSPPPSVDIPLSFGTTKSGHFKVQNDETAVVRTIVFRGTRIVGEPTFFRITAKMSKPNTTGTVVLRDAKNRVDVAEILVTSNRQQSYVDASPGPFPAEEATFEVLASAEQGSYMLLYEGAMGVA